MSRKQLPEIDVLERFFYVEDSDLYWKVTIPKSKHRIGDKAGGFNREGYRRVKLFKKEYLVHRIIWKMHYKKEPPEFIDHVNQCKADNRISNMRESSASLNRLNNTACGYSWHKLKGMFASRIKLDGKLIHLGYFSLEDDAKNAYLDAKAKHQ